MAGRTRPLIRAVLFDLDGTLYDRDEVVVRVAHEQFETFRSRLPGIDRERFVDRTLALDDHGYAGRFDVYGTLLSDVPVDVHLATDLEAHFWDCYCRHCVRPDDAVNTLEALRAAGKTLAVVTNGPVEWQSRKLRTLGLAGYFDHVLISEAEGISKPDARIFERALARCGVAPHEAMFVGDHPEIDISGARAAGMRAAWKRVPYWTMGFDDVIVVDRLSEILQWSA
jgi:putative hydrolase of the HAD superfamily